MGLFLARAQKVEFSSKKGKEKVSLDFSENIFFLIALNVMVLLNICNQF